MAEKTQRPKLELKLGEPRRVTVLFDGPPLSGEGEFGPWFGAGVKDEAEGEAKTWFFTETVASQLKGRLSIPADQPLTLKKGTQLTLTQTARETAGGHLAKDTEIIFGWNGEELKAKSVSSVSQNQNQAPIAHEPPPRPGLCDLSLLMATCYRETISFIGGEHNEEYPPTSEDVRAFSISLFIEANRQGITGERAARDVACREVNRLRREYPWDEKETKRLDAIWEGIAGGTMGVEEAEGKVRAIRIAAAEKCGGSH